MFCVGRRDAKPPEGKPQGRSKQRQRRSRWLCYQAKGVAVGLLIRSEAKYQTFGCEADKWRSEAERAERMLCDALLSVAIWMRRGR